MMKQLKNHYLVASDFDQTLSFNDSGHVLSELLGLPGFEDKVRGLARQNFVQQGAELSYLLRHDPEFRVVRREHLVEAGKRVRLKHDVHLLPWLLDELSHEQNRFSFYVVSASPLEVVQSALEGIVDPERIIGTRFEYDDAGEIRSIVQCTAGYGKVAVVDQLQDQLGIARGRIIYIGDGSSDIHVMLHVNRLGGLTVAVSENPYIKEVARRTVLSDDMLGMWIPILEEVMGWGPEKIEELLASRGLLIHQWVKVRSDSLVIRARPG
jgi:HAD superfamily phosphoserine phosphatase-like hydrolase